MAPQIPQEVRQALAQAKRVLGIVMRLKTSKILFNEPVDPVALGLDDYLDKVSSPMDFGTIMSRLQEGEKAGWKNCHYLKTENVLRDVQLVFDNCFAYNDGPGDEVTRELCSEVKANFEKRWREASLPLESVVQGSQPPSVSPEAQPVEWMGESDVPAELSYVQEDLHLPVRHLDVFQLCQLSDLANMEALEDVDGVSESIVAQGQIIPAGVIAADGASESIYIRTGPLLSWALDYAGTLSVLVQTETAWYRLHSPAPFYAGTYTSVQQKVEMCAVARDVARKRKKLSPAAAAQEAATELGLAEDDEDIAFAEAQLLALAEISASTKPKDRKGAKAPADGGRSRKRKASAEPEQDRDAGASPALLVPGPPSMQAAAAKQLENANEDDLEPADDADEGGAESGAEEALVGEEEEALDEEEEEEADQPKRKRRRRKRKRVIVQDDDDVPMTRKEKLAMWRARRLAAKAAEEEAADAERQAEAAERAQRDRAAAAQRGPVPEPARSFRLPQQLLPDLLVLWELLQTLAPTLQTPYIPLWRFEAALCPGPIKAGVPAVPELAQSPEEAPSELAAAEPVPAPDQPDQAADSKEEDEQPMPPVKLRIKMGRGRKPKAASDAEAAAPVLAAPLSFIQPTDDAGVASGLVLRELHAAVLRGIDGRGGLGSIGAEAPRTAKLALSESQAAVDWTRRVSRVILDSPPFAVDDDSRAAALHLSYAEYDDMSTTERLALLRGLCSLLLSTDAAREVVGARLEAIAALQPKPKKDGEEGKDEDQGAEQKAEGSEAEEKSALAPPPPAKKKSSKDSAKAAGNAPGSVEEWEKWVDACGVGVRQPLGVDYQGRTYRALGSRACAWRIFVEEPGGDPASSLWGFYEGDKILELVAWLENGEISTEEDLLEALAAAPLPRKGTTAAAKSALASGDKEAPPVVSAPELEARRWDGYRGMVAPQLLGSWNWPGAMLQAGYETRMRGAIDALLCRLPFWYSGEAIQMASLEVYQAMSAASSPSDLARVLPLAEKLLCQAGLMRATWAEHWQHSWQRATSYCVDWKHALLLTASLQAQLRPDRNALSRPAFSRIAHDERCQLYFPVHGDQVVLLRTGVLMHIKKYMQTLGLLPLDIPEKPQAAEPAEEAQSEGEDLPADAGDEDEEAAEPVQAALQLPQQLDLPEAVKRGLKRQWHALQDTVQQLRPIERFRVVGVAFRRSFLDGSSEVSFLDVLATDELQVGLALWPCAWILMEPSRKGPPFQTPHSPIAVPIRIDQALPDFLVRSDAFDKGMHRIWNAGDRFRMYFGGRAGSKSGGVYYRGQVAKVFDQQPDIEASEERQEQYDPWEAVEVIWDGGKSSSGYGGRVEAVNPWELEVDPDFERTEDEIKRDQEAEQRALRSAALAMRREEEDRAEAAKKEAEKEAAERAATQAAAERLRGSALRRAPSTPGDSGSDAAPLYMPSRLAAGSHGAVPADVLDMLRSLGEERFLTLLANWHRGVHGKFKVPVFAHQELDLFKVFWSVMEKGGYEIVSANKQWKEVCRCLDVDLTGQTSASFNMRQNYERCLFEFEDYLASGAYVADVNAGRAPSADAVVPFNCRHPIAQLPAPGEPPKRVLLPEREPSEPREPLLPMREGSSRRRKYRDMDDIDGDDVIYDDEDDEEDFVPEESPQPTRRQGKGARGGKGAKTFGPAMHAAGRALIGKLVLRYWEDQGGWWEAAVGDYLIKSGKHKLIYDAGGEDESFETADLRTLTDDEIKPHSQHPLPGLSRLPALPAPAQPQAQISLPPVPAVPGATPEQSTAMTAIVTALQNGVPAEDLKGMVEAAAAALQAAAEQDRVKATPDTLLLLAPPALKAEASTPAAAPLDAVMAQEGSDREPGTSGAEDASGRRSGRLSVKIRLKSAAQPSHSPGAGQRRGRKRRLDPPGAAASDAEGADAQPPERKRHRLATASRSASPMSEAPEEKGGQPNGVQAGDDVELSSAAAHLSNGQIERGGPEPAPADHSHPAADSPIDVEPQINTQTNTQVDMDTVPGPSAVPSGVALAATNDIEATDGTGLPAQTAHATDETGAPEMEAEQQGKDHGTEALKALSIAAENAQLLAADNDEMHELLGNANSTAPQKDMAGDSKAQDLDMVRGDQPASLPDEQKGEALASEAAGADMADLYPDMQPESELPGMHPSKPEGLSVRHPVQEHTRASGSGRAAPTPGTKPEAHPSPSMVS